MSSSQDDFDRLRRLLASKRYEQPPPGYFNHFSDRVIARIEEEEFRSCSNWWAWLIEKLEAKPILVCAYSMAVSSLLLVGYRVSSIFDQTVATAPLPGGLDLASVSNQPPFPRAFGSLGLADRSAIAYTTSLRPALRQEPLGELYRSHNLQVQAVGFSPNR
ncbi:MAG: hypothetical protein L0Z50_31125 [Verrucomicrobiales bacterium]|nr:hypothetical protein [Verrucomicrobiales bacterium]